MKSYQEILKNLVEKRDLNRSTILKPLGWITGICSSTFAISFYLNSPPLVWGSFFGLTIVSVLMYLIVYVYCLSKNPDLLRTESHAITKMIVEKSLIGDSSSGLVEMKEIDETTPRLVDGSQP